MSEFDDPVLQKALATARKLFPDPQEFAQQWPRIYWNIVNGKAGRERAKRIEANRLELQRTHGRRSYGI
jgi:hypothetical protein